MPAEAQLGEVLDWSWRALAAAAASARHPFHLGTFGSLAPSAVRLRTVVLRRVEPATRTVYCHSDRRAGKLAETATDARVGWLFYDPGDKVQIRLEGTALLHFEDAVADRHWADARLKSRRCYLAEAAPGTAVPEWDPGLTEELLARSPTRQESEAGRCNFAVIETRVEVLEWLSLAAGGHGRARFEWATTREPEASWLLP